MSSFKNKLNFEFEGVTMQPKIFSQSEIDTNIMYKKIKKQKFHKSRKIENDIETIKSLISELNEDEELDIFSKVFDSPNIVSAFSDEIINLYVATWAITPAGISALEEIATNGIIKECIVLLDKTHSYKWLFQSDAYKILKGKVKFKFCANHSKYICFKLKDGRVYNFIGSMNFTNNPRYENMRINKCYDDFEFNCYFIKQINAVEV